MCIKQNIDMKQAPMAILSPYEASIVRGTKNSSADIIISEKRTKAILDNMLACKGVVELEDGTQVEATIEELLIASAISKELEQPKGIETIEKLAKIRGELDDKVTEVSVSLVDKDLAKRALD